MNKKIMYAALATSVLSACGGGTASHEKLAPGDEFSLELSLDDKLIETSTYRAYGISKKGQLVTTADDLATESLIPIQISRSGSTVKSTDPALPDIAAIQIFFPQLWEELARRSGTQDAKEIAKSVQDLDISLPAIYQNYRDSGLDLVGFVDFYEALDSYPDLDKNEMIEAELSQFLSNAQVTPRQLLDVLQAHGSSWNQFLALMASRKDDFNGLYEQYKKAGGDISDFVNTYLQNPIKAVKDDKGSSALDVAKFVWQVIKDNRPETVATGAFSRALSSKDTNWENYGQSKSGSSQVVTLKAKGKLPLFTLYEVKFALSGYYGAKHNSIDGTWLPLMNMDVQKMYAIFSWKVNATARITSPVNVGTAAAPIPEMPVFMEINESGLLQNSTDKYEFRANGKNGFSYVRKF